MRFHFRASIKPIFENRIFFIVLEAFYPPYEAKISNRCLSVVYGSLTLNFFVGFGNYFAPVVNRGNDVFLGHPTIDPHGALKVYPAYASSKLCKFIEGIII